MEAGGVDHARLTIVADPAVWTDLESGTSGTSVRICGPAMVRQHASAVLMGHGLAKAPYTDYDLWIRP